MNFRSKVETERVAALRAGRVVLLAAVVLLAGWLAVPMEAAQAAKREDSLAGLDRAQRRLFQNYTRLYCQQFFRFEDDRFVLLPNYKRSRENSSGRSYDQAFEEMTEKKTIHPNGNTLSKEIKIKPQPAEVIVAAKLIPAVDVGHYGFVNCVEVKEVVGPSEMIVSKLELIPQEEIDKVEEADKQQGSSRPRGVSQADHDANLQQMYKNYTRRRNAIQQQKEYVGKTYRLLGFSTADLSPGDLYYGPREKGLHIAVMSTDAEHDFVLVNYAKLKRVRTNEFAEALAYVEMKPLAFIEMVRENREKLATKGDKTSLISIYRRYYNRYRPKPKVSEAPPMREPVEPEPEPQVEPEVPGDTPGREPTEGDEPAPTTTPQPKPKPQPVEEEEDDWDYEEDTQDESDEPDFFGIPL